MSRILIIKLGALGDFVQAFGAFSALRTAHPSDQITLLTGPAFVPLARTCPWFDTVVADPRPALKHPLALWQRTRLLRRQDTIFDLQTSGRSCRYRRLAGRRIRWCGTARGCSDPHTNPHRNDMHTLARLDDQLQAAGISPVSRTVPAWLRERGPRIDGRYAVLVPGAASHRPQKRWPAARFAALAQTLEQRGLRPVIIGSREDIPLAQTIKSACPEAIDLTGQTDLPALAGVLGRADIVIGNDTGPLHLAAAMDAPLVALFSQDSDPRLSAPLTISPNRTRVLSVPDLAHLPNERLEALLPL